MSIKTIVITRPSGQARQLSEMLQSTLLKNGVDQQKLPAIISLPLLTIVPKSEQSLAEKIDLALKNADLVIFVSPNAIECTMRLLEKSWVEVSNKPIPIGVVGGSSMAALQHHGIGNESPPTQIILPEDNANWDLLLYPPQNMLLVNIPVSSTVSYQYVMNTISGAWSRWTNIPAYCWYFANENLYFGTAGTVCTAHWPATSISSRSQLNSSTSLSWPGNKIGRAHV